MNKAFKNTLRVRYGETDKMGFVYYGNYALYLEVARTELLRSIGLNYANLEAQGIQLPVVNLNINYRNAAKYDDVLHLSTRIDPKIGKKIRFLTNIKNEQDKLVCEAEVTLVFMDSEKGKLVSCPADLKAKLEMFI